MTKNDVAEAISASERRGSDRKKLIVDVKFDGGDATGIANTRDIGVGGLYMTTGATLKLGTPIYLTINIGEKDVSLEGTVVYIDPGQGVGVRFHDLSAKDEELLKSAFELG